jgi:hypothetical protein
LVDFYNFEVVTTVQTEYDQPTQFPTISFCSLFLHLYDNDSPYEISHSIYSSDEGAFINPNNHYESFISPLFGKCFRFNSGKNMTNHIIPIKNSTSGGYYDAYWLTIHAPYGLRVWIHNKSSPTRTERGYLDLTAGMNSDIALERTFESKLEWPYNNCLKDVSKFQNNKTLIDYFLNRNLSYTQESCLDLCFDLFYIKENPCQCKEAELGNVFEKCWHVKEKGDYSSCTWKYRTNFTKNDLVEKCFKYCPLECDSMSFSYSISAFNRPNWIRSDQTSVYVYYKTLKYTSITQQAKMKWEQLISNLGGYLGLFVGLSFVSLFEITEIVIELIYILIGKRNTIQQQVRPDKNSELRTEPETLETELVQIYRNKSKLDIELAMHKKETRDEMKKLRGLIEIIQMKPVR